MRHRYKLKPENMRDSTNLYVTRELIQNNFFVPNGKSHQYLGPYQQVILDVTRGEGPIKIKIGGKQFPPSADGEPRDDIISALHNLFGQELSRLVGFAFTQELMNGPGQLVVGDTESLVGGARNREGELSLERGQIYFRAKSWNFNYCLLKPDGSVESEIVDGLKKEKIIWIPGSVEVRYIFSPDKVYEKYRLVQMKDGLDLHKGSVTPSRDHFLDFAVELDDGKLRYSVRDPYRQIQNGIISVEELPELEGRLRSPLNLDDLQPLFPKILKITADRGHTLKGCFQIDEVNVSDGLMFDIVMNDMTNEQIMPRIPNVLLEEINFSFADFECSLKEENLAWNNLLQEAKNAAAANEILSNQKTEKLSKLDKLMGQFLIFLKGINQWASQAKVPEIDGILKISQVSVIQEMEALCRELPAEESEKFLSHINFMKVKTTEPLMNMAIANIASHCMEIDENSEKKKLEHDLVLTLLDDTRDFYHKKDFSEESISKYVHQFSKHIIQKERSLNIPRNLWYPILTHVGISLTVVGLFAVIGKVIYANLINKKASPFLFSTTSYRRAEEARKVADGISKTFCKS